jgi:hypothetical protein
LNTSIAISSSLMRRCRIASSSSRATWSGQNAAPCADHARRYRRAVRSSGALIEMVAMRALRSMSTLTKP